MCDAYGDWSADKDVTLLKFVEEGYPVAKRPFVVLKNTVQWDQAGIQGKTPQQCLARFKLLTSMVRSYRTVAELAQDARQMYADETKLTQLRIKLAKSHPDFPSAPLSAFKLYCRDEWRSIIADGNRRPDQVLKGSGERFNALPREKRDKYEEEAEKLRRKYEANLERFRSEHEEFRRLFPGPALPPLPPSPFQVFAARQGALAARNEGGEDGNDNDDKVEEEEEADRAGPSADTVLRWKQLWLQLPPEEKTEWIRRALLRQEDYADQLACYAAMAHDEDLLPRIKQICSAAELALLRHGADGGSTRKPPAKGRQLFMREHMAASKGDGGGGTYETRVRAAAAAWRGLTDLRRSQYDARAAEAYAEYQQKLYDSRNSGGADEDEDKDKEDDEDGGVGKRLTWNAVRRRGVFAYARSFLEKHREELSDGATATRDVRAWIIDRWEKMSDRRRARYEERAKTISWGAESGDGPEAGPQPASPVTVMVESMSSTVDQRNDCGPGEPVMSDGHDEVELEPEPEPEPEHCAIPRTPFELFSQEFSSGEGREMSDKKRMKKAAEAWETMSRKEKRAFKRRLARMTNGSDGRSGSAEAQVNPEAEEQEANRECGGSAVAPTSSLYRTELESDDEENGSPVDRFQCGKSKKRANSSANAAAENRSVEKRKKRRETSYL